MHKIAGIEVTSTARASALSAMTGRFTPNMVVAALLGQGVLLWDADKIVAELMASEAQAGRIAPTGENDRAWQRL